MLFRTGVKLYLDRQSDREGSRIKTKLVLGALALSLLPVVFLVSFSYGVLNRTVEKWFTRPAEGIKISLIDTAVALGDEVQNRAQALANWIALIPGVESGESDFSKLCVENRIAELRIESAAGVRTVCDAQEAPSRLFTARASLADGGTLVVRLHPLIDLDKKQAEITGYVRAYDQLAAQQEERAHAVSAVHFADRAVHSVRRHLDRPDSGAPDQRRRFRLCWAPWAKCAKATWPTASPCAPWTNWPRWSAASTK